MSIIAWIILGAIAGYLAGFLVKGDEGLGVIGHIVLGIVGALVGGFLASVLFNSKPIDGAFDISSIVVATIGAIITVLVVGAITGRSRTGTRLRLTQLQAHVAWRSLGTDASTERPPVVVGVPLFTKELLMSQIIETIDVDVPVRVAYDQWTQFEEFPLLHGRRRDGRGRSTTPTSTGPPRSPGSRRPGTPRSRSRSPMSGSPGMPSMAPRTPAS